LIASAFFCVALTKAGECSELGVLGHPERLVAPLVDSSKKSEKVRLKDFSAKNSTLSH
jgi:hypothetical protein